MDTEYQQDEVSLQKQQQHQQQLQHQKTVTSMDDDDDDDSDSSDDAQYSSVGQRCSRHFQLTLASNFSFVVASAFYIALGAVGLRFMKRTANYPDYVLEADDDATWHEYSLGHGHNDDVIFTIGRDNGATDDALYDDSGVYYVTLYELFYLCGAMGFVFTGVLDCMNEPDMLGGFLILAGMFGLSSAVMTERDEYISEILNAVSVHLFLIEAAGMLYFRHTSAKYKRRHDPHLRHALQLGKACFLIGSLIDVILSYISLLGTYNLSLAKIEIFSATLWYICSLIFILHTVAEESKLRLQNIVLVGSTGGRGEPTAVGGIGSGGMAETSKTPLTNTRSTSSK